MALGRLGQVSAIALFAVSTVGTVHATVTTPGETPVAAAEAPSEAPGEAAPDERAVTQRSADVVLLARERGSLDSTTGAPADAPTTAPATTTPPTTAPATTVPPTTAPPTTQPPAPPTTQAPAPPTTQAPPPTTAPPAPPTTQAPPQPSTPQHGARDTGCEGYMHNRINQARANAGRPGLAFDWGIQYIAVDWSDHMAGTQHLAHNPNYGSQIAKHRNYRSAAENVGYGPDLATLFQAFMDSPGHRKNIESSAYSHVTVGCVKAGGTYWVTQNFWG